MNTYPLYCNFQNELTKSVLSQSIVGCFSNRDTCNGEQD